MKHCERWTGGNEKKNITQTKLMVIQTKNKNVSSKIIIIEKRLSYTKKNKKKKNEMREIINVRLHRSTLGQWESDKSE